LQIEAVNANMKRTVEALQSTTDELNKLKGPLNQHHPSAFTENVLWALSRKLYRKWDVAWLPIVCPFCFKPLSAKIASIRVLCLHCNREFTLKEVQRR
jgi:hypothetical protein